MMLVERSFLRRADARAKLGLGLAASAAVMLPLAPLALVAAAFAAFLAAARLGPAAAAQLRRIAPLLLVLFAVDWLVIGAGFALLITLRLAILVTAFTVLVCTTTPDELRLALERLGLPHRLAFALASAYRSLGALQEEWRTIVEAQQARGVLTLAADTSSGWRERLRAASGLVVPAIVLATQRAWALTEAASVRGLDAPHRRRPAPAPLGGVDRALLGAAVAMLVTVVAWR